MRIGTYAIYRSLLIVVAFLVFRVVVRRNYRNKGQLTLASSFLKTAIFGLWAWFAYVNAPGDWPMLHASTLVRIAGWPLFAGGMGLTLVAIAWLGLLRSFGHDVGVLR